MGDKLSREEIFNEIKNRINNTNGSDVKVICIVGGAASGKTTFARELVKFLKEACTISTDDFLIGNREFRRKYLEEKNPLQKYNSKALNNTITLIKNLKVNESLLVPTYDDVTGEAVDAKEYKKRIGQVKYIIVEGDFHFVTNPDLLIYYDVDDKIRLNNRIKRDLDKRKRSWWKSY